MRGPSAAQWFEFGFWMVFAGLAWYFSYDFSREVRGYRYGADTWPRLVIILMAIAATGQLVSVWRQAAQDGADADQGGLLDRLLDTQLAPAARMGFLLLLPIVYALLLEKTGFYFTTPVFLALYLLVSGERRWSRVLLIPLIISGAITLLFTRYLYMSLPVGYWPGFYDFSNWLVVFLRS